MLETKRYIYTITETLNFFSGDPKVRVKKLEGIQYLKKLINPDIGNSHGAVRGLGKAHKVWALYSMGIIQPSIKPDSTVYYYESYCF